MIYSGT